MTELPDNIITRKEWGKKMIPKQPGLPIDHPIEHILFEHSRYFNCDNKASCLEFIQLRRHWDGVLGLRDLKFNFMIGEDGHVYEGRGWSTQSDVNDYYPTLPLNKTLNIGYFGFDGVRPSKEQTSVSKAFIKFGIEKKYIVENPTFYSDL